MSSSEKAVRDQVEGNGLQGAGVGALIGAVVGGFGGVALGDSATWLAAPLSVVSGAVTLGVAKAVNERKHAKVIVGKPLPVGSVPGDGRERLTQEIDRGPEGHDGGLARADRTRQGRREPRLSSDSVKRTKGW